MRVADQRPDATNPKSKVAADVAMEPPSSMSRASIRSVSVVGSGTASV